MFLRDGAPSHEDQKFARYVIQMVIDVFTEWMIRCGPRTRGFPVFALLSQSIFYFILFYSSCMAYITFEAKVLEELFKVVSKAEHESLIRTPYYSLVLSCEGVGQILA